MSRLPKVTLPTNDDTDFSTRASMEAFVDGSEDVAPQPPRRRGRPKGSTNRNTRTGTRTTSLKTQIGGFLMMINVPLQMVAPSDALDPIELDALATALDQQCQTSPRFKRYMESMLKGMGGVSLVGVVGVIAGRRAIRHNLIPVPANGAVTKDQLDGLLGGVLSMAMAKPTAAVNIPPIETTA